MRQVLVEMDLRCRFKQGEVNGKEEKGRERERKGELKKGGEEV